MRKSLVSKKYGRKMLSIALAAALTVGNLATAGVANVNTVEAADADTATVEHSVPTVHADNVKIAELKVNDIVKVGNTTKFLDDTTNDAKEKNAQGIEETVYYGDVDGTAHDKISFNEPDGNSQYVALEYTYDNSKNPVIDGSTDNTEYNSDKVYRVVENKVEKIAGNHKGYHLRRHVVKLVEIGDLNKIFTKDDVVEYTTDSAAEILKYSKEANVPGPDKSPNPNYNNSVLRIEEGASFKNMKTDVAYMYYKDGAKELTLPGKESEVVDAVTRKINFGAKYYKLDGLKIVEDKILGTHWAYNLVKVDAVAIDAASAIATEGKSGLVDGKIEWDGKEVKFDAKKVKLAFEDNNQEITANDAVVKANFYSGDGKKLSEIKKVGKYKIEVIYDDYVNYGRKVYDVEVVRTAPKVFQNGETVDLTDTMTGDIFCDGTTITNNEPYKVTGDAATITGAPSIIKSVDHGKKVAVIEKVAREKATLKLEGAVFNHKDADKVVRTTDASKAGTEGTVATTYSSVDVKLENVAIKNAKGEVASYAKDVKLEYKWSEKKDGSYSAISGNPKNAGDYKVEVSVADADRYCTAEAITAYVKIKPAEVAVTPKAGQGSYYGQDYAKITYTCAGDGVQLKDQFKDKDGSIYFVEVGNSKAFVPLARTVSDEGASYEVPGEYGIELGSLANYSNNYKITLSNPAKVTYKISKLPLDKAFISATPKFEIEHNGALQKIPAALWTDKVKTSESGTSLVLNTDFITYADGDEYLDSATDVGEYKIKITVNKNDANAAKLYEGSTEVKWSIVKTEAKKTDVNLKLLTKKIVVPYTVGALSADAIDVVTAAAIDTSNTTAGATFKYRLQGEENFVSFAELAKKLVKVGTYTIEVQASKDGMNPVTASFDYEVRRRVVYVTAKDQTVKHWDSIVQDVKSVNVTDATYTGFDATVEVACTGVALTADTKKKKISVDNIGFIASKEDVTDQFEIVYNKVEAGTDSLGTLNSAPADLQIKANEKVATHVYDGKSAVRLVSDAAAFTAKRKVNDKYVDLTDAQLKELRDSKAIKLETAAIQNAGKYNIGVTVTKDTDKYSVASGKTENQYVITPRSITDSAVELKMAEDYFKYTGSVVHPEVSFKYANDTDTVNESYEVGQGGCIKLSKGAFNQSAPNIYKLTIAGTGNYTGTKVLSYVISPISNKEVFYTGKAQSPDFEGDLKSIPGSKITYLDEDGKEIEKPKYTDAGEYTYNFVWSDENSKVKLTNKFTIKPKYVAVKYAGASKTFSQADPDFSKKITELVVAKDATQEALIADFVKGMSPSEKNSYCYRILVEGVIPTGSPNPVVGTATMAATAIDFNITRTDKNNDDVAEMVSKSVPLNIVSSNKNYVAVYDTVDAVLEVAREDVKAGTIEPAKYTVVNDKKVQIFPLTYYYDNYKELIDGATPYNNNYPGNAKVVVPENDLIKDATVCAVEVYDSVTFRNVTVQALEVALKDEYMQTPKDDAVVDLKLDYYPAKNYKLASIPVRLVPLGSAPLAEVKVDKVSNNKVGRNFTASTDASFKVELQYANELKDVVKVEYAVVNATKSAADIKKDDADKKITWKETTVGAVEALGVAADKPVAVFVKVTGAIDEELAGTVKVNPVSYACSDGLYQLDVTVPEIKAETASEGEIENGFNRTEKVTVKAWDENGVKEILVNGKKASQGGYEFQLLPDNKRAQVVIPADKNVYKVVAMDAAGNKSEEFVINPMMKEAPVATVKNETILGQKNGEITFVSKGGIYVSRDDRTWKTLSESALTATVDENNKVTISNLGGGDYLFKVAPNNTEAEACYVTSEAVKVTVKEGTPVAVEVDEALARTDCAVKFVEDNDNTHKYNDDVRFFVYIKRGYVISGDAIEVSVEGCTVTSKWVDKEVNGALVSAVACTVENVKAPKITVKVINLANVVEDVKYIDAKKEFAEYKKEVGRSLAAIEIDEKYTEARTAQALGIEALENLEYDVDKDLEANIAIVDKLVKDVEEDIKNLKDSADFKAYVNEKIAVFEEYRSGAAASVVEVIDAKINAFNAFEYLPSYGLKANLLFVDVTFDEAVKDIEEAIVKAAEEQLIADKKAFAVAKEEARSAAAVLVRSGDSVEVEAIVDKAVADVKAAEFDEDKSLEENVAVLEAIVKAAEEAVEIQRAAEAEEKANAEEFAAAKEAAARTASALTVTGDSAEVVAIADKAVSDIENAKYDGTKSLKENVDALDAIVEAAKAAIADQKAAEKEAAEKLAAFAAAKEEAAKKAAALAEESDSDAVKALAADAVKAINEAEYDDAKSLEENVAALDAIIEAAKVAIANQKAAEEKEAAEKLEAAKKEFAELKKASVEEVKALVVEGDSADVKLIVAEAVASIASAEYDEAKTSDENKAVVNAIVEAAKKNVEAQKAAEKEAAKAKAFAEAKASAVAEAEAFVAATDSEAVKAIAADAVKAINEVKYDDAKSLEENVAALKAIVANAGKAIEAKRAEEAAAEAKAKAFAEAKAAAVSSAEALVAATDSEAVKAIAADAVKAINEAKYDDAKSLEENVAALTTIVADAEKAIEAKRAEEEAAAEAAKKAAFEEYKAIVVANAKAVATATDSAAVVDLVAASAAAIEAVEYDATKTFDESKAALDQMLVDLVAAVNELRNSAVEVTPGDVDMDGEVTLDDVLLALQAALKVQTVEGDAFVAADVDGDGEVTLDDVLVILQLALKVK